MSLEESNNTPRDVEVAQGESRSSFSVELTDLVRTTIGSVPIHAELDASNIVECAHGDRPGSGSYEGPPEEEEGSQASPIQSDNPSILQSVIPAFTDSPMPSQTPTVPLIAEELEMDESVSPMNEKLNGVFDEVETSDHGTEEVEAYSEEDSSSEDDVEEEEPALKYEVVGGSVQEILAKDSASALDVSQRLMVGGALSLSNCLLTSAGA